MTGHNNLLAHSADAHAHRHRENFPVASLLLPKAARGKIVVLYHFARHADDISDNPALQPEQKTQALDEVRAMLKGDMPAPGWVSDYREFVSKENFPPQHGLDLLSAFTQDATKLRYANVNELLDYCNRSAAPVGRAVLEICGEKTADMQAADTLCNALQIINHLQDMKEDFCLRNRVYLPLKPGEEQALAGSVSTPALVDAKHELLDVVDGLLSTSRRLPSTLSSRRLRLEMRLIQALAELLSKELRVHDPVMKKVKLSGFQRVGCLAQALWREFAAKSVSGQIAQRSRSSFFWPMLALPRQKRAAMLALYAFCRTVDDVVDEAASEAEARAGMDYWRQEIAAMYEGRRALSDSALVADIRHAVAQFNLPRQPFETMCDAFMCDIGAQMNKPPLLELERYCYGVASCVGLLSIEIFGYENQSAKPFAEHLGQGMQLINILRDVREDAVRARVYLPNEALEQFGLSHVTAQDLQTMQPAQLAGVYGWVAERARWHLHEASKHLAAEDVKNMRSALLMREVYVHYLKRMEELQWQFTREDLKLGMNKLKLIALLAGLKKPTNA